MCLFRRLPSFFLCFVCALYRPRLLPSQPPPHSSPRRLPAFADQAAVGAMQNISTSPSRGCVCLSFLKPHNRTTAVEHGRGMDSEHTRYLVPGMYLLVSYGMAPLMLGAGCCAQTPNFLFAVGCVSHSLTGSGSVFCCIKPGTVRVWSWFTIGRSAVRTA